MILAVLLLLICDASDAQSSFSTDGVPCYLHSATDGCHYRVRHDPSNCTSSAQRENLSKRIAVVSRTLVSLEEQLIRLGVIPPDNACSKLPPVENGGIIYDDLNLAPGATGRYTCFEGYTLLSFNENGRYEYTCTEDGIWDGAVTAVPVKCQLSSESCGIPKAILNGTITYVNNDSSNTLIGDIVVYSCWSGYELMGPSERFCLRSGNWSGEDPTCTLINEDIPTEGLTSGDDSLHLIIGVSTGSAAAVVLVIIMVTIIACIAFCCKRMLKSKRYYRFEDRHSSNRYELFDDMNNSSTLEKTKENVFKNSLEDSMDPVEQKRASLSERLIKKPRSASCKKPSLQIINETAADVTAIEKEKIGKLFHKGNQVVVKGDDEDSL